MHSVSLSWAASTDVVDGYNVYKGSAGAGSELTTPINPTLVTTTTYVDTTVVEGESLVYYVTAKKGIVESLHSNEVSAVILPAPPTALVATVA